jgi:hypothetical protein
MCNIENLKRALEQTGLIKERVELAMKIQQAPISRITTGHLTEILGYINDRVNHLHVNLAKGVAIEQELQRIDELVKDMPEIEVYFLASDLDNMVDFHYKPRQ